MFEKMYGVVPPMVTPFDTAGAVDFAALDGLVDFLSRETDGLFVTGSYGSGPLMTVDERADVTRHAVAAAEGRVPVIAMVGTTNSRDSVELARRAASDGAAAVAAVGPYYFAHDAERLKGFYGALIEAVDIPVYLYNNPKFQGYPISLETIAELKKQGLRGVKDATFDMVVHANYRRKLADERFDVALGTEALWLPARSLGCESFIPGLGNAFPELCRRAHRQGMAGEWEACRESQFLINELREVMYLARSTQLAVYAMLELRGIISAYPRLPFSPATDGEKRAIAEALRRLGLL